MGVEIISYEAKYQPYFERFNKAWLEEYFSVEPIDKLVLENPQENIIDHGGEILFAVDGDTVIGTVALKPVEAGVMELTKMAVDKGHRGCGAGKLLCESAIRRAQQLGTARLVLYSSTRLENAIGIYRKMGFREIPLKKGTYGRADIMMEKSLID